MPPNATNAFLKCVLPAEGFYCAVVFMVANPVPGIDFPRQYFFETVDELADTLLFHDAQGRTVYHACASYINPRLPKPRTQANAKAARALWLEADAGPGKPHATAAEAAHATLTFARAVGLPDPVLVGSGRGVHAYWPLDQDIDAATWGGYARGLKQLCADHGFAADPARTADIASILRPPGSHHRKDGDRLVQCDPASLRQHSLEVFAGLLAVPTRPTGASRQPAPVEDGSVISRIFGSTSHTAVYADRVADGCAQVAALRTSGNIPEPHWYAAVGVLSRCEDGEVKAHEWSARDYPRYTYNETQHKIDRTKALTGATTCAKLDGVNPGVCTSCQFFGEITSPISLGYPEVETVPLAPVTVVAPAAAGADRPGEQTAVQLPRPPEPFAWSRTGQLIFISENNKGIQESVIVTENPIYLDSVQTGELDRASFSYRFKSLLPRDGWADIVIDAKELHGAAGIAAMAGKGVIVHDSKLFLNYVRNAVDDYHENTGLQTRYDQFGWKNDNSSFLYGKYLYTPAGPVEAIGAKEVQTRCQWLGPSPRANLLAWTEAADSLFASQMEALSAVVLASFAAPLMRFQDATEGGAILYLFTPESGKGKSTSLLGASSVWGKKEGLSITNDDTRVSKPIAIGTLSNLPVIYDELRNKDPEVIKSLVVMFTEGRDRMRGTVDGTIRHTKAMWQTVMLSAGNRSLIDQLTSDGVDAPAFRVLELSAFLSESKDNAAADRLKRILTENSGAAGDAYLRYLMLPEVKAWAQQALAQWTSEIWKRTALDNPHRFRVRLVGAIAVAARIVNELGILHFQTDRIVEWLISELMSTRQKGTVSSVPTLERAINSLGEFINEHYGETVVVPDRYKPKTAKMMPLLRPHNRLSIRYEIIPQRLFIQESAFRDWANKKQLSPRLVLGMLKDHGVIIDIRRNVTLSAGTDIPGAQVLCIEANTAHPAMAGFVQGVAELVGSDVVDGGRRTDGAG